MLRSAVEQFGLEIKEKPGISAYARALRKAEVLDKQNIDDIDQAAGVGNQAAHGEHEALSREYECLGVVAIGAQRKSRRGVGCWLG